MRCRSKTRPYSASTLPILLSRPPSSHFRTTAPAPRVCKASSLEKERSRDPRHSHHAPAKGTIRGASPSSCHTPARPGSKPQYPRRQHPQRTHDEALSTGRSDKRISVQPLLPTIRRFAPWSIRTHTGNRGPLKHSVFNLNSTRTSDVQIFQRHLFSRLRRHLHWTSFGLPVVKRA